MSQVVDIFTLGIGLIAGVGFMIIISPIADSRIASRLKPKISQKTDFNEMCQSCFGSMISKMPLRTVCDMKEVERQRMLGCRHNSKLTPAPPTTEYLRGNEPDFSVKAPNLIYPKTKTMPCGHYNIGCTEYMCNDG